MGAAAQQHNYCDYGEARDRFPGQDYNIVFALVYSTCGGNALYDNVDDGPSKSARTHSLATQLRVTAQTPTSVPRASGCWSGSQVLGPGGWLVVHTCICTTVHTGGYYLPIYSAIDMGEYIPC